MERGKKSLEKNKGEKNEFFIDKRMTGYDEFSCIADKCKFTCCSGWDINIDYDTYNKLKKEGDECKYILDKLKIIEEEENIIIDKEIRDACPFLDNKGLCNIVKNHGDDYLSKICKTFPRLENIFEGVRELTLSCSCPEVVDIIEKIKGEVTLKSFHKEDEENINNLSVEFKIRDTIIKIIKEKGIKFEDKLIISYGMILNILNSDELTEEFVLEEINKYNNRIYIDDLKNQLRKNVDYNKSIKTINNLFLDIIENYKNVPVLKEALKDISNISMKIYKGKIKINELVGQIEIFNEYLNNYNSLIENCIVVKILGDCLNEDIEEIAISLQLILLEYLLVKYSLFLKMFLGDKGNFAQNIKDYIVVFSRIIGNNSDAVIEFIEEKFGDILITEEYLELISVL